ncbi:hypothetical protein [Streptomyces sp. MA15]|uniref:hypothetical protein n=1 Tax=Streptomyces sp. MA15 TaxID=3055061 RepID=UPI0025AEE693|nr:hypothetical protein [Streptomyces sp. MA15]MDN3270727.1 hypothetical protein [Streptomyces sp. MA15]
MTALHDTSPTDVRDGWTHRPDALLQERYEEGVGPGLPVVHAWHRHAALSLVAGTVSEAKAVPLPSLTRLHAGTAAEATS